MKHAYIIIACASSLIVGCSGGGGGSGSSSVVAPITVSPPTTPMPSTPLPPPPEPVMTGDPNNLFSRPLSEAPDAPLASMGASRKLEYGLYANRMENRDSHIIPDFSYAGYMDGGVALPTYNSIPIQVVLSDDGDADDHGRVQSALDRVAALAPDSRGIKGAVLLEAGNYTFSAPLLIESSGVVLRGEGPGLDGTILLATTTAERSQFLIIEGDGNGRRAGVASDERRTVITQEFVPVGSDAISVQSVEGYAVGDRIGIERTPNEAWVGASGVDTAQYDWSASSYSIAFERTVVGIEGNQILFDAPMADSIVAEFGGAKSIA